MCSRKLEQFAPRRKQAISQGGRVWASRPGPCPPHLQPLRNCSRVMEIRLSNSDGVPVYRQIMNQVKYMIASGRLQPGQELPPIRVLAERLVINHNTVVHAYAALEREGLITCRQGSGSFVADRPPRQGALLPRQDLSAKVDSLLSDAAHLSMDLNQILQLILERHAALKKDGQPSKGNVS